MKRTSKMKIIFVVLAVMALAAAPCAWDSRTLSEASWLATIFMNAAPPA